MTIFTSVGKYLYAGEIRVKTHFMSRETYSIIQGKRCRPIREHDSSSIGSKQSQRPKQSSLGQAMTHGIRTRDTRIGAVGDGRPSADHLGRPTGPLHQPTSGLDVAAPNWS